MTNKTKLPKEIMIFIQDKEISIKVKLKGIVSYTTHKENWKIHSEGGESEVWVCRDNPGKLKDKTMLIRCVENQTKSLVDDWNA